VEHWDPQVPYCATKVRDTVVITASLRDELTGICTLFLEIIEHYPTLVKVALINT
jgi:hypothetical protein